MKITISKNKVAASMIALISLMVFTSCSHSDDPMAKNKTECDSLKKIVARLISENETIAKNLAEFDTLDYVVFSNQDWTRLHESHSNDVKVHWPDGHTTTGIERHIEDLKAMFVYAPDTKIKEHPIRFGSENMTCVIGLMTGTFSAPMPMENGKSIKPTGKSFSISMCTVGIWKNGVMMEEYLFWDNQTFMKQVGLVK